MNTASLELCKELYELSGWKTGWWYPHVHIENSMVSQEHIYTDEFGAIVDKQRDIPAYDLGYLLRKLPNKVTVKKRVYGFILTDSTSDGTWIADYIIHFWQTPIPTDRNYEMWLHHGDKAKLTEADTPEDAVAKLCIELVKQGLLK